MKLYYILEDEDFNKNLEFITIDLNKATKYGYFYITIQTLVQTDFRSLEDNFRAHSLKLDTHRPKVDGDKKCKVFKGKSAAKFYTGFTPLLKGYNGKNGLIQYISVYQCDPKFSEYAAKFTDDTFSCGKENEAQRPPDNRHGAIPH